MNRFDFPPPFFTENLVLPKIPKSSGLREAAPAGWGGLREAAGQFMGLVNSANNRNVTNHLFTVEFDTILNLKFNDISSALSAGGSRHAELQKGAGKKACSCGSSERQGQPSGRAA
uniref:Legume lectin domain-containing protein n=1 Tax=Oryza barthii TaxID=65489 RepID=A0A0D3HKG6_9ORYZ